MSHLVNIKTVMKDLNCVVAALERMGYKGKIERHNIAQNLNGYERNTSGTSKQAHIIIRKDNLGFHSYNDIGFEQLNNGTVIAHIDNDYRVKEANDKWLNKVGTYYNVEKSKVELKEQGLKWTEIIDEKDPEKRIRLEVNI